VGDLKGAGDRVRRAVDLLAEELRRRVAAHPAGHLVAGRGGFIDLHLRLPVVPRDGDLERAAADAGATLAGELQAVLSQRAAFRPGRVFCLRCGSALCEHAAPGGSREVFAGYGPTGLPRFVDFGQWLLERADPRVDQLYEDPPRFLAYVATGADLAAGLLPAFRDRQVGFRLHGQVAAGWYRGTDAAGHPEPVALSLQVASTRIGAGRRLYGLNLVAVGPGGESLEAFCSRLGEIPWTAQVRWGQSVLEQIGGTRKGGDPERERRIRGLLAGLAFRLEKDRRARERRTLHAGERHSQGDRPTRMALADLARAPAESVVVDARHDTLVVLGERGRAHVWNRSGKLVTSIRYSPESIARRRKEGHWRDARPQEVAALRARVEAGGGESPRAAAVVGSRTENP
jgi:hypothetical protein